jgi:hypothetical protein
VAVVNEPTVHARQWGAWDVSFDCTRIPFHRSLNFNVPDGTSSAFAEFVTPAGHLLVIEQVSARGSWIAGNTPLRFFTLETRVGDAASMHLVPALFNGSFDFTASQQVRVYGDANSLVRFWASRPSGSGVMNTDVTITGSMEVSLRSDLNTGGLTTARLIGAKPPYAALWKSSI